MPKKSRKNVGLIGLGIIGSRVANALRQGGFHVYVWNRTPRAAPNFVGSPRQVAELCDIIQVFVGDAHALFEVLEAMGDSITPSHTIICNATIGPEATIEAAKLVQGRGAQFLDAPFTGSKVAAQNRELVYYIGGDDKTFQSVEPVLQASSKAIIRIGKIGDAATVKVATNMVSAVTAQTLAEAYAVVQASGIDPKHFVEALKNNAARSGVSDLKLPKMIDRDYEPHFSLKHMFKDVQLAIHIANSLDIDLPATTATAGVMYGGLTKGWADLDFSVLARAYQKEPELLPPAGTPPKPEEKSEPPKIEPPKPEPPKSEAPKPEAPKSEPPKAEPPKPEAPKADKPAEEKPAADKPADSKPVETRQTPPAPNGQPANPAAEAAHTPLIRLRRWFGTAGSAE